MEDIIKIRRDKYNEYKRKIHNVHDIEQPIVYYNPNDNLKNDMEDNQNNAEDNQNDIVYKYDEHDDHDIVKNDNLAPKDTQKIEDIENDEMKAIIDEQQKAIHEHEKEKNEYVEKYIVNYCNRNKGSTCLMSEIRINAIQSFYDYKYGDVIDVMMTEADDSIQQKYYESSMNAYLISEQDLEYEKALLQDIQNGFFN